MEVMLEPICYNPEEREVVANKNRCPLKNKIDFKAASLNSADVINQQIKAHTINGESAQPQFQIIDIQWQYTVDEINFRPVVVDTLSYINGSTHPVDRTFKFSWNTQKDQRTTWRQQWGDEGSSHEYETKFPNLDISVKITHNQMRCTSVASVPLSIAQSVQASVTPRTTAIAQLVVPVSEIIELSFTATIKSIIGDDRNTSSEFKVEGSWSGTLHKISSSKIRMFETEIGIM